MKGKQLFFAFLLMLFVLPMAFAQENDIDKIKLTDDQQEAFDAIEKRINLVTKLVSMIGGAIAALAAGIVGIMMMQTKDPSERDQLKERLKYIIMGGVLIAVAPWIVNFIFVSKHIN